MVHSGNPESWACQRHVRGGGDRVWQNRTVFLLNYPVSGISVSFYHWLSSLSWKKLSCKKKKERGEGVEKRKDEPRGPSGVGPACDPASRAPGGPLHSLCSPPPLYKDKWVRTEKQSEMCGSGCGRKSQQHFHYVLECRRQSKSPRGSRKRGRPVGPGGDSALGAGPASWPSETSAAATAWQRPTEAARVAVSDYS